MDDQLGTELITYLWVIVLTMLLLIGVSVWLVWYFYYTKVNFLKAQSDRELSYLQELTIAKSEMQEQTLIEVGRELHDGLGQLLVVAKLQLEGASSKPQTNIRDTIAVLDQCHKELRAVSHSLSLSTLENRGILSALEKDFERLNKISGIRADLVNESKMEIKLERDKQIILYRIIQEFMANSLKHSKGDRIRLRIQIEGELLVFCMEDNGMGFDLNVDSAGAGLTNMRARAELLDADFSFLSSPGKGTKLKLIIRNGL